MSDIRTSAPSEAQVEAAAKIIRRASLETTADPGDFWSDCYESEQEAWRNAARAALVAAQGAANLLRESAVPDAATELRAERDAALAAIERVQETLSLHNPNGRLVKEVLAALDGAPEPEVKQ